MTHLTEQDIRRLARLARLELPENELGPVRDKLNAVIALIDRLQAVDTGSVAAMSHPHDPLLRLRDDLLTENPILALDGWIAHARRLCEPF
ncbi:MAG: Asp-tRNA(Asn)/Glu-tRNA(Gln) amidotransferase GatCAB subunit C [Betaproteobacteria bacterium]|nr:Asp-tRNA(Asn)/Glu-tRNA(Gln) amidotransferase GatCAB subunit C [Betaproteobacteria bacterium]